MRHDVERKNIFDFLTAIESLKRVASDAGILAPPRNLSSLIASSLSETNYRVVLYLLHGTLHLPLASKEMYFHSQSTMVRNPFFLTKRCNLLM